MRVRPEVQYGVCKPQPRMWQPLPAAWVCVVTMVRIGVVMVLLVCATWQGR